MEKLLEENRIERVIMKTIISLIIINLLLLIGGCGNSNISGIQSDCNIEKIAIASGSGVLGDAVGVELFNRGFTIIDSQETTAIIGRMGLKEFEVTSASGYEALKEKGIDAVLSVKTVDADDGTPESASVRITDTSTGQVITGLTWQNKKMGSKLVYILTRKNLSDAAKEIAEKLSKRIKPKQ